MILIIESGATKADWCAVQPGGKAREDVRTAGMNLATMTAASLQKILTQALTTLRGDSSVASATPVTQVHFYAAGLLTREGERVPDGAETLDRVLRMAFPFAEIEYASDLLAAARAVCGHAPGIAAILGTGSNSCLYDGKQIVRNVRSGGFILGDEGGGARLGRLFVADFLKGLVPEPVASQFAAAFPVDYMTVVHNVYRGPSPSGYLGAFAPWIMEHYDASPYVKELVDGNFRDFIERVLKQYDLAALPVGVVGGFGYAHRQILQEVARPYGIRFQTILATPMDGLVAYHGENA